MRTTQVRFRNPLPYCGRFPHAATPEMRAKLAGQAIAIYVQPQRIDPAKYLCDATECWRIVPGELTRLTGEPELGSYSVCAHQAEID